MSVTVKQLSKHYGRQKAVNNINFHVKKGEIVGFLGPNGAGKTTTMKIMSCFIPPSSGKVLVCGHDVQESPMEVRRCIGYLPEHNPLYLDMYVREYLELAAKLHNIRGKAVQERIVEMVRLTGLEKEQHKKIGQLSKGYRQRVGLAQAMIHDPQVLILDEPTSGLDPNQLAEIRQVITTLGKEKTVILSTHIMQEVQAMCDRVIIINNGEIVADDTAQSLQQRAKGQDIVYVEFEQANVVISDLEAIEGVAKALATSKRHFKLLASPGKDIRAAIFNFAVQKHYTLLGLRQEQGNLEDIFRRLTNKSN